MFYKDPCLCVFQFLLLLVFLNHFLLQCITRTERRTKSQLSPCFSAAPSSQLPPLLQNPNKNSVKKSHFFHPFSPFILPVTSSQPQAWGYLLEVLQPSEAAGLGSFSAAVPLASPLSPALCSHLFPLCLFPCCWKFAFKSLLSTAAARHRFHAPFQWGIQKLFANLPLPFFFSNFLNFFFNPPEPAGAATLLSPPPFWLWSSLGSGSMFRHLVAGSMGFGSSWQRAAPR